LADRPRQPYLAGFLSFVATGLGQVYNGEWRKALVLNAIGIAVGFLLVGLLFTPIFHLVLLFGAPFGLGLWIYGILDAVLAGRKRAQSYELRWFNRVPFYIALFVAAAFAREGATTFLRENFVQAFRIPAESMLPTLQVGDHLFVDRRPAGKRLARGDVIAFAYPEDPSRQYVKRVVAVGGDLVEIHDKVLSINGQAQSDSNVIHIDPTVHGAGFDPRDNFGPSTVPEGWYFVLGDNRDNSNDSRFWGPVEPGLVIGKALGIYWSFDPEKKSVRWDRIGRRFP
jgi:signal peptidase I